MNGFEYKGRKAETKITELLGFSLDEYNTVVHLHQEAVREIVDGNEESRDKAINKILGIDVLSDFEELIAKQVHQSSSLNKSLRGLQKIVDELGIQREATEKTVNEETKALEKTKAKLIDRGIDVLHTSKESAFLFSETISEMLTTANDLGLDQLATQISGLQNKAEKRIEEDIDEAIAARRNLRSAIQDIANKVKNGIVECDLLEKQLKGDLKQIAELNIDIEKDVDSELKTLETQVAELTNEISDLQTKESRLIELRNDVTPVLERLSNVSIAIESIVSKHGDENVISNKQDLLDKQEVALKTERTNLGAFNTLVSSALKYISTSKSETCPVCDKPIVFEDVLSSLEKKLSEEIVKRMKNVDTLLEEVKTSKEQLNSAKKELNQLKKDMDGYNKSLLQIREKYKQFTGLELIEPFLLTMEAYVKMLRTTADDKKRVAESSKSSIDNLNRASSIIKDLTIVESKLVVFLDFHADNKQLPEFIKNYIKAQNLKLSGLALKNEKIEALNKNLDLLEDIATFMRRSVSLSTFEKSLKEIDDKLLNEQNKLAEINSLVEALLDIKEAVNSVKMESLELVLSAIHGDLNAFYSKMSVHPMFGEVKLIPEERRGTHIYRISAEGKTSDYKTFVRTRLAKLKETLSPYLCS